MRYFATSLLLAWFALGLIVPTYAEETPEQKAYGVREETPNQRRVRLGQPIEASYPAQEYGELIETPNQARKRLAIEQQQAETLKVAKDAPVR
jgi:hypothetical protein